MLNVVDIGGYTADILQLVDFRPNMSVCTSLYCGTNTLFQRINEQVRATGARNIPDTIIESILLDDAKVIRDCTPERIALVDEVAIRFANDVLMEISQSGLDMQEHQTAFMGGGSMLLKKHIENSGMVAKPYFVDDVQANAKGYKVLYDKRQEAQAKDS